MWRKWIKECVGTASASVLGNGSPTSEFSLKRGLQQRDPLSPFLFLIRAEGLNVMMQALVDSNLFTGYKIGTQRGLYISHLQFIDDSLLLGEKSWANVRALRAVLLLFESASGLKVNFHKSVLTGVNIGVSWLAEAASSLHCKVGKSLLCIWVCWLVEMLGGCAFGILLCLALQIDCPGGRVGSFLLAVV